MISEIVPCTLDHIAELCNFMRQSDKDEIESFGISVTAAALNSYNACEENKTVLADGKVAACFGVYPLSSDKGHPWLLTTVELEKINPLKFYRMYKCEVDEMLLKFHCLENYVDARYTKAVRLLEILGFSLGEPEPYGDGIFRKFSIYRGS